MIIITHGKINGKATVNLKIDILDSRTNYSSRLKKAKWQKEKKNENKRAKVKKKREKKLHIYLYIYLYKLLFMIRGMLSAYSKRKRYLLHFEFQN